MTGQTHPDRLLAELDVYVVGGAVRDALLGLPAGDRDWVVVGATPEKMVDLGFTPVGGDFPVFLHPQTREEYALARTERKSGRGYKGFTFHTGPDVTLEEDLGRRDLTVNAIAQRAQDADTSPHAGLVDPYGGVEDLANRVFRHVGAAFVEDPVRILRLARFTARFADFSVAPETMALCRHMVDDGEVDALVPERVWKELSRGLMSSHPDRMLDTLAQAGALARIAPQLVWGPDIAGPLTRAAAADLPLPSRYALLCVGSEQRAELGKALRAPTECMDQARLLRLLLDALPRTAAFDDVEAVMETLEAADALRKPERLMQVLRAAGFVARLDEARWREAMDAVRAVDAGAIAKAHARQPAMIKDAVRHARLAALASLFTPDEDL